MKIIGKKRSRIDYRRQSALGRYVSLTISTRSIDDVDVEISSVERERTRDQVNSRTGLGELEEGEKGRRENLSSVQNSHKFAQNELHTGVCSSLCEFENVLFSKENRTHKSHTFAQCEQNDHAYLQGAPKSPFPTKGILPNYSLTSLPLTYNLFSASPWEQYRCFPSTRIVMIECVNLITDHARLPLINQ